MKKNIISNSFELKKSYRLHFRKALILKGLLNLKKVTNEFRRRITSKNSSLV